MRLGKLPYRPEENLSDAELESRLENIEEKLSANLNIKKDEHAPDEKRRAADYLHSKDISYFHRLRWITRAESDKRRSSRELIIKQGVGEGSNGSAYSNESDRKMLVWEIESLRKSIDSAIVHIEGERLFIKEHQIEIGACLTATGFFEDDDLRPPETIVKSESSNQAGDTAGVRAKPGQSLQNRAKKEPKLQDTRLEDCDLVTNPPTSIIVGGKKYHLQRFQSAEGVDLSVPQTEAVTLFYRYGIPKVRCAKFLGGISTTSVRRRLKLAERKIGAKLKSEKRRR